MDERCQPDFLRRVQLGEVVVLHDYQVDQRMTVADIGCAEIVNAAYRRGVPAKKFVKLLSKLENESNPVDVADQLASSLLDQLLQPPGTPAIVLSYLSQSLSDSTGPAILPAQTFLVHLLFRLALPPPPSTSALAAIASLLLACPSSLFSPLSGELHCPASLVPDVGSSTSTSPTPTLGLVLPLLRLCSTSAPAPIVSLTARILGLVQPYPAPPLDVGLEAGGLLQTLPEMVSTPLRDSLGGLMADLAISQDTTGMGLSLDGMTGMENVIPNQGDITMHGGDENAQTVTLPPLGTDISSLPLPQSLAFLLNYLRRSSRWTDNADSSGDQVLLRLAPHLAPDPTTFLAQLLEASIVAFSGQADGDSPGGIEKWLFISEGLPSLLQSWKGHGDLGYPYPDTLATSLKSVFERQSGRLAENNTWMAQRYDALVSAVDSEDETGGYVAPDGWSLCSLEVTLLLRLIELDLLSRQDARSVLPGVTIPSSSSGESLSNRVAVASPSHLPPLAHLIIYSPGAARSFASEVSETIQSLTTNPPPDNLFSNLSASPSLIACLAAASPPAVLLGLLEKNLLDRPDDVNLRADDPQGTMTRFGEGVMLVEAAVHTFDLPLPRLLVEGRRALSLGDWEQTQRGLLNGWIKALFGSDGIDDQILSATSLQDFYRLAPSLIQQAIAARAAGQIDIDTLYSGLSYFSQDLLSWSLGGIVAWLCEETVRNGPVSGLHLQVLQRLVLGDAFPEALLRVAGGAIAGLLAPSSGLHEVFAASGIDVAAVRLKLEAIGVDVNQAPPLSFAQRIANLRVTLQTVRQPELSQSSWTDALLPAFNSCLVSIGDLEALQLVLSEILFPSSINNESGDPLGRLFAILTVLGLGRAHSPLLSVLLDVTIPNVFEYNSPLAIAQPQSQPYAALGLAKLIKHSLLMATSLQIDTGGLVHAFADDLEYQSSRPVRDMLDRQRGKKAKRARRGVAREIGQAQKAVLEMVVHALGADEELRGTWPVFERFT
ncbi:mediator complex subunit Med5-domain-containing protein [Naematelia encephala]|uniref:Mediator of RNA polymerase II transcription subunit 5 n=1 Tax=Naematelia encephala TaxID=71784 RepID=A0A1Y2AUX0_9TREE|nr:mediator complex subunit Med5-domain-containing protein [Naematelia encephala]